MSLKELVIKLALCNSEKAVIDTLKEAGLWDNPNCWRPFGDLENNWSTIGNQQSEAEAALVEKIINSIDAMLMKECLVRGITPDSKEAPRTIAAAMEEYFHIKGGKLQDLTPTERTKLAKSIVLTATGYKPNEESGYPCITIVDRGEGQTPKRMPETILSISKSNKLKVPFVQGKFNMGGTGVLRFCGEHSIQLVISKRCPDIENTNNDPTFSQWGFTVIRRERPKDGHNRRSSIITYLVGDDRNIMSFDEPNGLDVIPTSKGKYETMHYGMYCKMYEFHMSSRNSSNINMALYSRLSSLLPNLAYPVYLDECRSYKAHSMFRTLSGLNVRLCDQASGDSSTIEETLSASFNIDGQVISATVYVFANKKAKNDCLGYAGEGILLTQNGQTHGNFDVRFYHRTAVGLSYLADSLLTIVDCSRIDETTREDLFMNSRDRMSSSNFEKKLEQHLEEFLKENDTLKRIQTRRREEAIANKLDDEKPLEDVLSSVFKSSSVLSKLFVLGEKLQNPTNLGGASVEENFTGKYNPTFFAVIKKASAKKLMREAQLGRKFRIKFKTDANNDFFAREEYPGRYNLFCNGIVCENHSLNLHNGTAVLSVTLPNGVTEGDILSYKCVITDTNIDRDFENEFDIKIIPFSESGGGNGGRTPPSGNNSTGKATGPQGITLPNVVEVTKEEWDAHNFTKESALSVRRVSSDSDVFDFFVNMENIHLQTEIKPFAKDEARMKLYKARYKYAMVLVGLSILGHYANNKEEDSPEEKVRLLTEMISPVILPMIEVMGSDMSDVLST